MVCTAAIVYAYHEGFTMDRAGSAVVWLVVALVAGGVWGERQSAPSGGGSAPRSCSRSCGSKEMTRALDRHHQHRVRDKHGEFR